MEPMVTAEIWPMSCDVWRLFFTNCCLYLIFKPKGMCSPTEKCSFSFYEVCNWRSHCFPLGAEWVRHVKSSTLESNCLNWLFGSTQIGVRLSTYKSDVSAEEQPSTFTFLLFYELVYIRQLELPLATIAVNLGSWLQGYPNVPAGLLVKFCLWTEACYWVDPSARVTLLQGLPFLLVNEFFFEYMNIFFFSKASGPYMAEGRRRWSCMDLPTKHPPEIVCKSNIRYRKCLN